MKKVLVVTRQLLSARPVATAVISESTDHGIDDIDHYLHSKADQVIDKFKQDVPEFELANWYKDIVIIQ